MNQECLISSKVASKIMDCSRNQILKLIKKGKLSAIRHNKDSRNSKFWIRSSDLKRFLIASCIRKRGRPRKTIT